MTVNPSPIKRAFVCPLCGAIIDSMEPHETKNAPAPEGWDFDWSSDDPQERLQRSLEFRLAQNMAANEAIIWAHFEGHHTLREAVLALGQARNALMDIRETLNTMTLAQPNLTDAISEAVERGLGGK
jgi:hypothetical protein